MDTWATFISWGLHKAAMNIGVFMFFLISVLGSFRYIPRSVGLHRTKKFLHRKGDHLQNKKTIHKMGEHIHQYI